MCRDRGYRATKQEHIIRFDLDTKDYFDSSYNQLAGTTGLPIVAYDGVEKKNTSVDALWGLVPFWTKDRGEAAINANKYVNAKVETVEESRTYKPLFERGQRCLIPCTHYFEHHWLDPEKKTTKKVPFAVRKKDDEIFTIPGLYAVWEEKVDGKVASVILSYTMLTTTANALLKKLHNGGEHSGRMPLVIERDMEAVWLKPDATYKELKEVMQYKIPASRLQAWPVHPIRGKHARTGPGVLEEWAAYKRILK